MILLLLLLVTSSIGHGLQSPSRGLVMGSSMRLHSLETQGSNQQLPESPEPYVVEYNENKGGNRMYGKKRVLHWDQESHMFGTYSTNGGQLAPSETPEKKPKPLKVLTRVFYNNFVPSGNISEDYFTYSKWRACQRFVSATSSVFGTQALVMALGVKSGKNLGIAAATAWVMKDALGKISRILWASNFGRKFDSDAKKWRYRASLLYAAGSALEVMTYLFPRFFLIIAATANGLKQMAMLTSSATRNAIYRSFARKSDNIGDVTAKGEAQIAIVDLLGIFAGVFISKRTTSSRARLVLTFLTFSVLDLFCIYNEIKSVVFNALNAERAQIVLEDVFQQSTHGVEPQKLTAMAPEEVGRREKVLMPAHVRENIFSSWTELRVMNSLLKRCLVEQRGKATYGDCPFVVTLHAKVASPRESLAALLGGHLPLVVRGMRSSGDDNSKKVLIVLIPQVLLHVSATKEDMLRAFVVVHGLLADFKAESEPFSLKEAVQMRLSSLKGESKHTTDEQNLLKKLKLDEDGLISRLSKARAFEKAAFPHIRQALVDAGWDAEKYMFSSVKSRVEFE